MTSKQKGGLALFTAATLYGFFGIFSRLISFRLPFFYQAWIRNVFSVVVVGILFIFFEKGKNIARRDIKWFVFRSLCGFVAFVGIYVAFTRLSIGTTYFMSYAASTVSGYLLGALLFGERLTRKNIAALALSIVGLLLVYSVSLHAQDIPYTLLAIFAGMVTPGWSVFSKKISGTYSNIQINLIDSIFAIVLPLLVSLVLREKWVAIAWSPLWLTTFLFGLMFLANGFLIVYGFRHVDAQAGTLILLFEVVAGIVLGYIFFRETIPAQSVLGGLLILYAIVLRTGRLNIPFTAKVKKLRQ